MRAELHALRTALIIAQLDACEGRVRGCVFSHSTANLVKSDRNALAYHALVRLCWSPAILGQEVDMLRVVFLLLPLHHLRCAALDL